MKKLLLTITMLLISLMLISCKPEILEIEIYTSDTESAASGEIVDVPLKVTFGLMGEDEDNTLPKAVEISKKYLPEDTEFSQSKGDWGEKLVITTSAPMGSQKALNKYLKQNRSTVILVVDGNIITLKGTENLEALDSELSDINFMLGLKLPAESTLFRITSDSKKKATVAATAVFSEEKAYLDFKKSIKKRKAIELEFKGGSDSVYSEIDPLLSITL